MLIAQSDLNHSVKLLDREYVIERGANRGRRRALPFECGRQASPRSSLVAIGVLRRFFRFQPGT